MKIQYLGHSSFKLTESTGISVVTDPYDDSVGYHMPETDADAVTVSHHHYDHDAISKVKGNPVVLDKETGYILKDSVEISSIMSFHDDCRGKKRGENIIFKFRMDGLDVCHLGDLGEDCSSDLIEMILPVNVLMIPVGGNYTIDAKKGCKLDIDKVDDFIDEFDGENVVIAETGDEIEISRDDLDGEQTTIIVMENGQ